MSTPLRHGLSRATGWLMDRGVPRALRRPIYAAYCRLYGADASEAELSFEGYASFGAFFVRRLRQGARSVDPDPDSLISPCDGTVQSVDTIHAGQILQAKGSEYGVDELLAGAAGRLDLEGGFALTIYLSPRDYHRVHAPIDAALDEVAWVPGDRRSVAPRGLERCPRLLARNERAVLALDDARGGHLLVMVGALNVGRIRVIGVEPGRSSPARNPLRFERGAELARFEMGSTVVLLFPRGRVEPAGDLLPGRTLRMGESLGKLLRP